MKKVTIYFKSGNVVRLKCKKFIFTLDRATDQRTLNIIECNLEAWMLDLSEIEAYTVTKCFL